MQKNKTFQIEDFFHLPPPTLVVHSEFEYLCKFSKKFETALMVYSGAWGNWFMKKTWSWKSRGIVPLTIGAKFFYSANISSAALYVNY